MTALAAVAVFVAGVSTVSIVAQALASREYARLLERNGTPELVPRSRLRTLIDIIRLVWREPIRLLVGLALASCYLIGRSPFDER